MGKPLQSVGDDAFPEYSVFSRSAY